MRHNLIKTDNYLLVVDDASEIKEGNYVLYHDNKISRVLGVNIDELKLDRGSIWGNSCKKIISHRALNGAPILEGVNLLPLLDEEIPKLSLSEEEINQLTFDGKSFISHAHVYHRVGYNIAREKYNLTLEKLIDMYIEKTGYGMDMWSKEENETMSTVADIIQSINQPKLPISFECEVEPKFKNIGSTKEIKGSGSKIKNKYAGNPKTIINAKGRTEWVGKYIYE